MIPALKSEFLKLLTVRATYALLALLLLLIALMSGYAEGFKAPAEALRGSGLLASEVTSAVAATGGIIGILAIMLFSHEYRYNTITYTLINTNSRIKVLLSKVLAMSAVALILTVLVAALSPLATLAGIGLAGKHLSAQSIPYADLWWHCLLYGWGYAMFGLLLVALLRKQALAYVGLFFIPSTIEPLLGLLLKSNAAYLPFTSLNAVLNHSAAMSSSKAAVTLLIHLVVWWALATYLFIRRDAN